MRMRFGRKQKTLFIKLAWVVVLVTITPQLSSLRLNSQEASGATQTPPISSEPGTAPPQTHGPMRVASGAVAAMLITRIPPIYPPEARAAKVEGTVVLHAIIGKDGTIQNLNVVSGPPELTQCSMDAVAQWKYRPYLVNGEPVEVETVINIRYASGEPARPVSPNEISQPSVAPGGGVRQGGVSPPQILSKVTPQYSEEARGAKFSGTVVVNLIVDTHGLPQNAHVLRGVGMGLDENALEAVKAYRFKPAMLPDGKAVPVRVNVEVNFKYEDKRPSDGGAGAAAPPVGNATQ